MDRKQNIIYHFRVRGTGAEGVHIAGIVNGFRKLSHRVRLVSPTEVDPTKETEGAKGGQAPSSWWTVTLHKFADVLPQPFFEVMEMAYNFWAIIKLWKAIAGKPVDFIYERYAFFNFAGAFISKTMKIPLVIEVNELSGHKRVRGQYFVRLCSFIERRVLCQATMVITVSDFLNHQITQKIDRQKTKVITKPNGVPSSWLDQKIPPEKIALLRERLGLQRKKVICFVGGLVHWHNFDLLIEALKIVRNKMDNIILMVVGDGPLMQYIRNLVHKFGLPPNVILFVGKIPHSEIPFYLKLADVAVIPETNDFRSPIKMFEYMAMGVPVVAPKKPAIETVITHKKEGLLFHPGNSTSLSRALEKCLSNQDWACRMGKAARLKVHRNYTWEKHSAHILQLLNLK